MFRFGRQIDVRPIRGTDFTEGRPVTERHVAAYIAKYATKGAETTTGTLDHRLRFLAELAQFDITDHARRMIHTAWHLATRPRYAHLRLRQWAHMLGFRGHFSTRTRRYSTTRAHLRAERTAWRTSRSDAPEAASESAEPQSGQVTDGRPVGDRPGHFTDLTAGHRSGHGQHPGHSAGHRDSTGQRGGSGSTLVISHWQYAGTGLLPELAHLSELLADRPAHRKSWNQIRRPQQPGHCAGQPVDHPMRAVRTGAVA